jgi:hypothetical protein
MNTVLLWFQSNVWAISGGAALGIVLGIFGWRIGYRRGLMIGKRSVQLAGGMCDICNKVAEKFYALKLYVVCDSCFKTIMANKEMKCQFCKNPVEHCSCT